MPTSRNWQQPVRVGLRVAIVLALLFLGLDYYRRWTRPPLVREKPQPVERTADFYVHPPKSYISDLESARKLIGQPLWVMEGYRWRTEAGRPLEPLEKIVPTAFTQRGEKALLQFARNGDIEQVAIGTPSRVYIDEMFLIRDPRQLYSWSSAMWDKVDSHQIAPGMTEFQVAFSLGAGQTIRSSPAGETRVVEYTLCKVAGVQPVRVTFQNGRAEEIEPIG